MGEKWRANVAYGPAGTKVEYEGTVYELIQPHTSQVGWEPTKTPALWRAARDQKKSSHHHHHSSDSSSSDDDHKHHSSHKHDDHKHDDHKHDDHKHESSNNNQQQQQPQQQQFQQQQNVVNTQVAGPAYTWTKYNGNLPNNAVAISNSLGKTFAVGRGNVQNGIHPGYIDPARNKLYTSFGGKEVVLDQFEVLTADPNRIEWVRTSNSNDVTKELVNGGHESDNTPTYVCKIDVNGVPYFGKTYKGATVAYYGLDDKEHKVNNWEILAVKN